MSIQDLPSGANDDAIWTRHVIPNFLNLILAGEHSWLIADNIIITALQSVWNHVFGNRVPFTIEKKSAPFVLVSPVSTMIILLTHLSRHYKSYGNTETSFCTKQFVQSSPTIISRLMRMPMCMTIVHNWLHLRRRF